ncbi:MAG: TetR family transcriptional regulator [Gammaproteobacteria bacterium]|jgi:AcrR family transcriptional regulator|nr:TetR family transcriptional regulator [Gammaproteobacteria bacterium]
MPKDTAERILACALQLFNDLGASNVSTNQIANEMDISPGNLHYHFRSRAELLHGLFMQMEQAMLELATIPENTLNEAEDIWLFLHLQFERQIAYRFWYREMNQLGGEYPALHKRFQAILELQHRSIQRLLNDLAASGQLEANALERATLSRNMLLIMNSWLSFSAISPDPLAQNPNLAVWQVLSLVAAWLRMDQRKALERLAQLYLQ